MIKLKDIVMIHDLKRQGLSIAAIARETGFDRKTVRRHLARGLEGPSYGPREPRPCKIDKYEDWLLRRTAEVPGLSARRLLREIRDLGFDGSYTTVTNFLREARPPTPTVFERRFETPPGTDLGSPPVDPPKWPPTPPPDDPCPPAEEPPFPPGVICAAVFPDCRGASRLFRRQRSAPTDAIETEGESK